MMMRKHGIEGAYEKLKAVTRGAQVKEEDMVELVNSLEMDPKGKN